MSLRFELWRIAHQVSGKRLRFPRSYAARLAKPEQERHSVRDLYDGGVVGPLPGRKQHEVVGRLGSVRAFAESAGGILADSPEINNLVGGPSPGLRPGEGISPCYPPPYVAEFEDILVHTETATLINRTGEALNDELYLSALGVPSAVKAATTRLQPDARLSILFDHGPREPIDQGLHLLKEYQHNYFHWIVEILPRLFTCERLGLSTDIPALAVDGLHPNLLELLNLVRHPDRQVLTLPPNSICRVRQLIYPSDLTRILTVYDRPHSVATAYVPVGLLTLMAQHIKQRLDLEAPARRDRRLYLRRASNYRLLLNEPAIEVMMSELGFEILDLASLSIRAQIETFAEAAVVVAPSGAGLANMLWCGPSTRILALHNDHPFKAFPYWEALANVSGSRIGFLPGPRAFKQKGLFATHDDYTIDPAKLRETLSQIIV